jgi:hypothetical protein
MHSPSRRRIPRPDLNEIVAMLLLVGFTVAPIAALIAGEWITAAILAFFFWPSSGYIAYLLIKLWRSDKPWEWPRIVSGPSIGHGHSVPARTEQHGG